MPIQKFLAKVSILLVLLLVPLAAQAQDVTQNFLAERVGTGAGHTDPYRPAGVDSLPEGTAWESYQWGGEPWFLVRVTGAVETLQSYATNPDVRVLPRDLSTTITSGQLAGIVAVMDELGMPSQWVTQGMVWSEFLRVVWTLCALNQRLMGESGQSLYTYLPQEDLSTQWNQLPLAFRNHLQAAADSLGMDYSMVTNTMRLRVVIYRVAQSWAQAPWAE